jgi:antiviral helicase SKI2
MLRDKQLLPVVCFVFSRKRCDDYLELVKGLDLNSQEDKHYVSQFFRQALSRLNESDRQLQQVINMQEMAKRGIAIHHSGVLPILRESVELLFQTGRIKVLFATETFASNIKLRFLHLKIIDFFQWGSICLQERFFLIHYKNMMEEGFGN